MSWSVKQLPNLTIWKNTVDKKDGYVTGIEPATGYPYNRNVERKAGRVPVLKPGQTRSFSLNIGLHEGAEAVKAAVETVAGIQSGRATKVENSPPVQK